MSGFLRHIVSRALGIAPVIQPRVLSRFEAAGAERAAQITEERAEVVAPRATDAAPTARVSEPFALEPAAPSAARTAPPREPQDSDAPVEPPVPTLNVRESRVIPLTEQRLLPAMPPPPASHSTSSPIVTPVATATQPAPPAPAPEARPAVSTLLVERTREVIRERSTVVPAAPVIVPSNPPPFAPASSPVRPSLAPAGPVAAPTAGPAEAAALPPVQITIGRIDVRAVPTPAPAPVVRRPRETRPLVSLDDYLKQRAAP